MKCNHTPILLLEGKRSIVWSSKTFLEERGYEVHTARSRREALDEISRHHFSALITEYILEGANTLNIVRQVKEANPESYVLLLTNVTLDRKAHEEVRAAGVDDYFIKPFPLEKILAFLEKGMRESIGLEETAPHDRRTGR
jgi:DNA-binding response OmpR family regulator